MNNKHCTECDCILTQQNWRDSRVRTCKYVCIPCESQIDIDRGKFYAVIALPSGEFKQVRQRERKKLLNRYPGSNLVGIYDKRETDLDSFVKSLGFGGISQIQSAALKNRDKKPRTAEQYARSIEKRVEIGNTDRIIKRYAREKEIIVNVRNEDGTLKTWFLDKYNATHCPRTGIEFQARGPFKRSADQIVAGAGYEEHNVQVVCLMYNWGKNRFSDSDVLKMCIGVCNKIKEEEELSGRLEQSNSLSALV